MQECPIALGSCSFQGRWGKSGSIVRAAGKSWTPGTSKVFAPFVSRGVFISEGETHIDMMSLMLIYTPVFASYLEHQAF